MNLAVLLLLLAAPPLPAEVLASPFGIVCPWPEVGAGGMGAVWVRCGAGATELGNWPGNEPFPGTFRFENAESEWQSYYQKEQLVPTPILGYTPRWASRSPESPEAYAYPPDPWAYLRYAEAVSRQFAGRVWYWEVWNEPNIEFFRGDIAAYADLVKAAAAGVRRGNPAARVVLGGVAGVDRPFLDRCYQHGVRDFVDVVACHPYQWGNQFNDGWFHDKLTGLHALLERWGDGGKPVWLNEFGWSCGGVTEEEQARLLVQAFVSGIARRDLGIQRLFWFCVKDWGHPDYGLYADDSHKKPAWHAYQTMVRQLAGRTCVGRLKTDANVRAYAFGEGDTCVVVVWSADLAEHAVTLPIAAVPTAIADLLGQPLPPVEPAAGRLPLTARPAPCYLTVPRAALKELTPLAPLAIAEGDPARHPLVWTSVYPQPGTDLPWLVRGQKVELTGRLFNASPQPVSARITAHLATPDGHALPGEVVVPVHAEPDGDATFRLPIACPADAPDELVLRVATEAGVAVPELNLRVLPGGGPTISFLANSHLERTWYLQPEPKGGCSESMRFGSRWVYRLPVPADGSAVVRLNVGANAAHHWTVMWSVDGAAWQPLLAGDSWPSWQVGRVPGLKAGWLYLKCEGSDQQVAEVRVTVVSGER